MDEAMKAFLLLLLLVRSASGQSYKALTLEWTCNTGGNTNIVYEIYHSTNSVVPKPHWGGVDIQPQLVVDPWQIGTFTYYTTVEQTSITIYPQRPNELFIVRAVNKTNGLRSSWATTTINKQ